MRSSPHLLEAVLLGIGVVLPGAFIALILHTLILGIPDGLVEDVDLRLAARELHSVGIFAFGATVHLLLHGKLFVGTTNCEDSGERREKKERETIRTNNQSCRALLQSSYAYRS